MNALVVDSVISTRKFIRSVLKDLQFKEIYEVNDGSRALKVLEEEEVNLIVADWDLQGFSGLELLKKIRNYSSDTDLFDKIASRVRSLPFILLSSNTDKDKLLQAINAKVSELVVKPYTAELLSEKITTCLKKRQQPPSS